ncbi:MAG: F0F1 ATP synthase subunit epsilon [Gammaproteobacteria bacterium]|nr:F0F1 ATP synthase subunit epsilon [Gammaproteobacteria bacterium]
MKTFTLILQDATHTQRIEQVTSFVGEDATGSFGILAGHARMMTSLVFGLARFRAGENTWQYLALPGAVLYFSDNELSLSTRRYLVDDDYERISIALHERLLAEEKELHELKKSLHHMEEAVLRRLWEIGHESGLAG